MFDRRILIAVAALPLAACDVASDATGEMVDARLREAIVGQCTQLAEVSGIGADLVTQSCECAGDRFMELPMSERTQMNQEKIQEILTTCAQESGAAVMETGNG